MHSRVSMTVDVGPMMLSRMNSGKELLAISCADRDVPSVDAAHLARAPSEEIELELKLVGSPPVVVVQQRQVVTQRVEDARVASGGLPAIRLVPEVPDAPIVEGVQERHEVGRRPVVNHDDLEIREGLIQHASDGRLQKLRPIECRDDYADVRHLYKIPLR